MLGANGLLKPWVLDPSLCLGGESQPITGAPSAITGEVGLLGTWGGGEHESAFPRIFFCPYKKYMLLHSLRESANSRLH